jgi:DNA-binding SARP family transcriptional activator
VLPVAMHTGNIEDLEQALAMYTGEIFPMDRYSDWSASRRKSLEELYLRGLLSLGQAYMSKQQFFKALECSRRILHLDAWNEDAVLLGMHAYTQLRDHPRAMRLYLDLQQTLDSELGLTPRSDLRALAEELRRR